MLQPAIQESARSSYRAAARQKHPPIPSNIAYTVGAWFERRRQRRALAELDDRLLDDVGLSREQARCEAAKPFWKR
jgi:uncharacterized protein YjiS (DUF1127 family)